jgi:hypothetical protein
LDADSPRHAARNREHLNFIAPARLAQVVATIIVAIARVDLLNAATVTVGFFAVRILQLGAGNLFSVQWQKRVDLTQMSSRMASSAAGFASLLVILPLIAVFGLVGFFASYWQLPWLTLVFDVALLAAGLKLYSYFLESGRRLHLHPH